MLPVHRKDNCTRDSRQQADDLKYGERLRANPGGYNRDKNRGHENQQRSMNAKGHRQPFYKQRLIDHDTSNSAKHETTDVFGSNARLLHSKHPKYPKEYRTHSYPYNVQPERCYLSMSDVLYDAKINSEENIRKDYRGVCFPVFQR